ncbi:hypothetical protein ACFRIB_01545 [Streptomyces mirabilis]|uniref:hypothetical protein n=1 Tax=Streptomyces mirabilis TaxID=68239 RepID=UPI00368ABE1A
MDRLYELLPAVHRMRDAAQGEPLKALLEVIEEQVRVVRDDIEGLYADWFVETCADWGVPYLGDLVGQQPLYAGEGTAPARILSPRRDVANAVANRRRKGTLALLEELAADVAGWPGRAVEFAELLGRTEHIGLYAPPHGDCGTARGRLLDLRDGDALGLIGGPFDRSAHTVDVRRPGSPRTRGRYDIPHAGLFVWRLAGFTVTRAPAHCVDRAAHRFTFSILGDDVPLVARPVPEPGPTHTAEEANLPVFITRRAFEDRTPDLYGTGRSLVVLRGRERRPIPLEQIVPADLSGWAYRPVDDQVAVDPVLGRIAFSSRGAPDSGVWVSYSYAFAAPIGGGEYRRKVTAAHDRPVFRVGAGRPGGYATLAEALRAWKTSEPPQPHALVEFTDSGVYEEPVEIELAAGDRLELRAAVGTRPVIRLLNWHGNRPDSMKVTGPETPEDGEDPADGCGPTLTLDGLLVTGRGIQVTGTVGRLVLRHCTLVPGWTAGSGPTQRGAGRPSLDLRDTRARVDISHCVLGPLHVDVDESTGEPLDLAVEDSVLDAVSDGCPALGSPDSRPAYARVSLRRTTVLGRIRAHGLDDAENSLFTGPVEIVRRATGSLDHCFVPPGSHTPPRHGCRPDPALDPDPERLRPRFTSVRYGTPGYAQLAMDCPPEIARGASDESELGAFHDLFQPQRTDALRTRLDQFTPAGMETGIFFVT